MNEDKTVERKYPLKQIYFYLTEGCNLACRHCWIAPKYQDEDHSYPALDFGLFESILEQGKPLGLNAVKLTGGEPLMHPQIRDILESIRIGESRLVVETNGVLCTPELARDMAACKRAFVSVSMDGVDAETHEWVRGVKGCFEAALNGIRNLVDAGLKPQIIMTIMRHNKHQMEPMVRLAESLGAGSVKFNIVQPTARGERMHDSGETLTIEELVELGRWSDTELSASTDLYIYYHHPAAFRSLRRMFGENAVGCGVCGIKGIIGVLSDGSYALCGIGTSVPELIFGRADADRLEDVWNSNPVIERIRTGLPERLEGVCGDCIMKASCLGSCIAQNYYRSENLWAPFWFCEEAYSRGLFPESRIHPSSVEQAAGEAATFQAFFREEA
jgi:SynChlorMet cassette radical SAM/SPASM protein ScmF